MGISRERKEIEEKLEESLIKIWRKTEKFKKNVKNLKEIKKRANFVLLEGK